MTKKLGIDQNRYPRNACFRQSLKIVASCGLRQFVWIFKLLLDPEECTRVAHSGFDLHPVANDLQIRCKLLELSFE